MLLTVSLNKLPREECYPLRCDAMYSDRHSSASETSVNYGITRRHVPEDRVLHSHCCENLILSHLLLIKVSGHSLCVIDSHITLIMKYNFQ
jgi:hypothetical protein